MRCDQLQRVCDAVRVTDDLIAMPHTPSLPSCPVDPHSGRMHNVSFPTFLTAVSILIDYGWRSKAPFSRFFFETNRVISLHFFPFVIDVDFPCDLLSVHFLCVSWEGILDFFKKMASLVVAYQILFKVTPVTPVPPNFQFYSFISSQIGSDYFFNFSTNEWNVYSRRRTKESATKLTFPTRAARNAKPSGRRTTSHLIQRRTRAHRTVTNAQRGENPSSSSCRASPCRSDWATCGGSRSRPTRTAAELSSFRTSSSCSSSANHFTF